MKHIPVKKFASELQGRLQQLNIQVKTQFEPLDEPTLNRRPGPDKWSILECMAHINLANKPYLIEIRKQISKARPSASQPSPTFSSNWLGNFFTGMMQPKPDGRIKNKMGTIKTFNPTPDSSAQQSQLNKAATFEEFYQINQELIGLLSQADQVDFRRTKVKSALGSLIQFRLGDAFRFLLAHAERHLLQASRAQEQLAQ